MKNKFYSCLATLLLVASIPVYGQTEPEKDADGYYLISNAEELKWFRNAVNTVSIESVTDEDTNEDGVIDENDKIEVAAPGPMIDAKAKLVADIELFGLVVNADGTILNMPEEQWIPIGSYGSGDQDFAYRGVFDGQGHTISGVYIDTEEYGAKGFFGGIEARAEIRNLGIINSYISSVEYTGGICGRADGEDHLEENGSVIRNCYFSGVVAGKGNGSVGGICGETDDAAKCIDCYNLGIVKEGVNVGGICGLNEGSLKNCYNVGSVSDGTTMGAICGYNDDKAYEHAVVVSNCYYLEGTAESGVGENLSEVVDVESKTADQFAGGDVAHLLGEAYGQKLLVTKAADTEALPVLLAFVEESEREAYQVYTVSFKSNYDGAEAEAFNVSYGNNGAEVSLPQSDPVRVGYMFAGWFDQATGGTQYENPITIAASDITVYAQWTEEAPEPEKDADGYYLISNAEELKWFRDFVNGDKDLNGDAQFNYMDKQVNAKLTADIDLGGEKWIPISGYLEMFKIYCYAGVFDGQGHTISGLAVEEVEGREAYGLFGDLTNGGTVKNLGIINSTIKGNKQVGAIAGRVNNGIIDNCFSTATVVGTGEIVYAGGLFGYGGAEVTNCYNAGSVSATASSWGNLGGIAGANGKQKVENCYNAGTLEALSDNINVGAIIGNAASVETKTTSETGISNCYYLKGNGTCQVSKELTVAEFVETINQNLFSIEGTLWKGMAKVEGGTLLIPTFAPDSFVEIEVEAVPELFAVTLLQVEGGTISADKGEAAEGETVTLSVKLDTDYNFEAWKVTDANGTTVDVSSGNTFTMPASAVTVTASYAYNPPAPVYYDLHFIENDSVILSSDKQTVKEGGRFIFMAEVAEGYDPATLVVEFRRGESGTWNPIDPDGNGSYRVGSVYCDIYVRASVEPLSATAIEEVAGTSGSICAVDGRVCVTVLEAVDMRIVNLAGTVVRATRLSAGYNEITGLQKGVYIVVLANGNRSKVIVR